MSRSSSPEPGRERRIGALDVPLDASDELVALLERAAGPPEAAELKGEPAAVAAFVTQKADVPSTRTRRASLRTIRTVAAVLIALVVLGGGLAAANVLPAPAQRWASRALNDVGIDVPSPDRPGPAPSTVRTTPDGSGPQQRPAGEPLPGPTSTGQGGAGTGEPGANVPMPPSTANEGSGAGPGASIQPSPAARSNASHASASPTPKSGNGSGNGTSNGKGNGNGSTGSGKSTTPGADGSRPNSVTPSASDR